MYTELVLKNKFGCFYITSEGWHINGQKDKFIASVKRQLKSKYYDKQVEAEIVMNCIKNKIEI
jgi:hypothetical protein